MLIHQTKKGLGYCPHKHKQKKTTQIPHAHNHTRTLTGHTEYQIRRWRTGINHYHLSLSSSAASSAAISSPTTTTVLSSTDNWKNVAKKRRSIECKKDMERIVQDRIEYVLL